MLIEPSLETRFIKNIRTRVSSSQPRFVLFIIYETETALCLSHFTPANKKERVVLYVLITLHFIVSVLLLYSM